MARASPKPDDDRRPVVLQFDKFNRSAQAAAPTAPAEILAFVGPTEDIPALTAALARHAARVLPGALPAALAQLPQLAPPRILMVDISEEADPLAALDRLADVVTAETQVVAMGRVNDLRLYRELIALGIADYLLSPVDARALEQTLERLSRPAAPAVPGARGGAAGPAAARVFVVIGSRGGVGATTVAVDLAWALAEQHRRRTALIDLDLRFGSAALALDVEPGAGLIDALSSPERIDGLLAQSAAARVSERLAVYGAEAALEGKLSIDPGAVEKLLEEIRRNNEYLVIDLPRGAAATSEAVLAAADEVLLVSDLGIAGLRDTVRLQRMIQAVASSTRIAIIANRVPKGQRTRVPQEEFERVAGQKLAQVLPEDPQTVMAAATAGRAVSAYAPKQPIARALQALALERLAEEHRPRQKRGLFSFGGS